MARLVQWLGYWEVRWWLSTSVLVITVYEAEGVEWSLVISDARQYRLDRSWYCPHWKERAAEESRYPIGVGRPDSRFKSIRNLCIVVRQVRGLKWAGRVKRGTVVTVRLRLSRWEVGDGVWGLTSVSS